MISEEFAVRVAEIRSDREALLELMAELDSEKRALKSAMRAFSNSPAEDGGLAGPERYKKLRRMKDRMSFLTEEREYVRQALGQIKMDQRALNRSAHSKRPEFCHAFYAAAERTLPEETFIEIEARAAQMIESAPSPKEPLE